MSLRGLVLKNSIVFWFLDYFFEGKLAFDVCNFELVFLLNVCETL